MNGRGKKPASGELDSWFSHAFGLAQQLHEAGSLADAEFAYRQILQRHPDHSGALHYLGAIAMQTGHLDGALELMEEARRHEPANPQLLVNLGHLYKLKGDYRKAEADLKRAKALTANLQTADLHLAGVLAILEKYAEAEECFRSALISLKRDDAPELADYLFGWAMALHKLQRHDDSEQALKEAIAVNPNFGAAHHQLGKIFRDKQKYREALETFLLAARHGEFNSELRGDLAQTFVDIGDLNSAEHILSEGLEAAPDDPTLLAMFGSLRCSQGSQEEAVAFAQKALAIDPGCVGALVVMGGAYRELSLHDEALECLEKAVALEPGSAIAQANLGTVLWNLGIAERAEACTREALKLCPDLNMARANLALLQLAHGDTEHGWQNFEYSIFAGSRRPGFMVTVPPWRGLGDDLTGKRLLVRGEQGLGDEIMFGSILPEVIAMAKEVVIDVTPKLVPLFTRSFPTAIVMAPLDLAKEEALLRSCDRQIMIGSLPWRLRPDFASYPNPHRFLAVDEDRRAGFAARLAGLDGEVKIAIAWRSQLMSTERAKFYMTLEELVPILSLPNTCFVSVQYDRDSQSIRTEVAEAEARFGVKIHILDDLDTLDDLEGVAALIDATDLVISAPSAVARIGGGLGKPTFEATPALVEQHLGQNYSPFTPSVRIIQPKVRFDKPEMMRMLEQEVRAFVRQRVS